MIITVFASVIGQLLVMCVWSSVLKLCIIKIIYNIVPRGCYHVYSQHIPACYEIFVCEAYCRPGELVP